MAVDITITHGVFIGIVILALGGNLLVILAFVFNKLSLKKPHNVFIFTLAVTDFVTALFLIPSKYLYLPPVPKSEVLAPHFCRLIWGSYFLFGFAGVSVNTCFMLAVERWLAVVKPFTYKVMTYKHAIAMAIFSWIWAYLWDLAVILQVRNLHFVVHILHLQMNTPFHKFILNLRLQLQFSAILSTLSIVNPFLNRTKDEKRALSRQ